MLSDRARRRTNQRKFISSKILIKKTGGKSATTKAIRKTKIIQAERMMAREEICAKKTALVSRLEDAPTKSHANVKIELDKYWIDGQAILDAEEQFAAIYPFLIAGIDYTPEDLLGHEYWANLNALARRTAIICLKHLAELGDVPLVDVSAVHNRAVLFQAV
jgi:hypothetical protein